MEKKNETYKLIILHKKTQKKKNQGQETEFLATQDEASLSNKLTRKCSFQSYSASVYTLIKLMEFVYNMFK